MNYQRQGQAEAAAACYRQVPVGAAAYPDARHGLGLLAYERGELALAEAEIRSALRLRPGSADYHYNLANVLAAAGRPVEAAAAYRQSLRIKPQDAAALNNLGNALLAAGEPAEAEATLRQALKYDRNNPLYLCNRANALVALGRKEEAASGYRQALALSPGRADAAVNLGALLLESGDAGQALAGLEAALAADPAASGVKNALAAVLRQVGREAEAEPLLRSALAQRPDFAESWNSLAAVQKDLGRYAEAETCARRAIALRADYGHAHVILGNILLECGRHAQAQQAYEQAVALSPDDATARWNLGLVHLARGDLARGFELFESRMQLPQISRLYPDFGVPPWRGEPVAGRRLLLYAEQGMGDTLQFIRYAPLLAAQGAAVIVLCPAPLARLLAGVAGVAAVVASAAELEDIDFACPMMSLPQRCNTTLANIPAQIPYLQAPPESLARWRERLGARVRPRVGLVWAGDPRANEPDARRIDRRRSLSLTQIAPLFAVAGIEFHSLQKGVAAVELADSAWRGSIKDRSGELSDFAETAALVEQLDLVISVDTSVVHLAGGLGKPVWVLSRYDACWRWLLDRDDSPWYPGLRLFRQRRPLDWDEVLLRLRAELVRWAERQRSLE